MDMTAFAQDILMTVTVSVPIAPVHKDLNELISSMALPGFVAFVEREHSEVSGFLERSSPSNVPTWTKFYAYYHEHIVSTKFSNSCDEVQVPPQSAAFLLKMLFGSVMDEIRRRVIETFDRGNIDSQTPTAPTRECDVRESGNGKIRYLGGRAIHKAKVQATREKLSPIKSVKIPLLERLCTTYMVLRESSAYPATVEETRVREYSDACLGLTYITDEAFLFFLAMERKRVVLYEDDSNRKAFGEEVLNFMRTRLLGDEELRNLWLELFQTTSTTVDSTEALLAIYEDVMEHYLNVADAQYRRSVLHRCQNKKTVEHRKQILMRSAGSEVTYARGTAAVSAPAAPAPVPAPAPQPPQYCICKQGEYGKMILCESASCKVGWFHFQCVGLKRKPRGKWFCGTCKTTAGVP